MQQNKHYKVVDTLAQSCRINHTRGEQLALAQKDYIMASKITTAAITAFMAGRPFNRDNTTVEKVGRNLVLCLYGNVIASRDDFESMGIAAAMRVTDAGFPTATTKERLNGIPGVSVNQRKGQWFLNGKEWDGSWIHVER